MSDDDFTELAARCEALGRMQLHMAVVLEDSGVMDGHRLQQAVLAGLPGGSPALDRSAVLMQELMANYSAARSHRRTKAIWSENRGGQNDMP